jgi:dihydroxy-acid dehydratase
MVRISDARMSGTAFGTIVVHIAPEAAAGGPLALIDDGDPIRLDVPARRLDVLVEERELAARVAKRQARTPFAARGYVKFYCDHVLQADEGCDFDFLRPVAPRS